MLRLTTPSYKSKTIEDSAAGSRISKRLAPICIAAHRRFRTTAVTTSSVGPVRYLRYIRLISVYMLKRKRNAPLTRHGAIPHTPRPVAVIQ